MFDSHRKRTRETKSDTLDSDIRGNEIAAREPHPPGEGYMYVYGLFNDVSNSDDTMSNDRVINK